MKSSWSDESGRIRQISNEQLLSEELPDESRTWEEVAPFALTFNGYTYAGGGPELHRLTTRVFSDFRKSLRLDESLTLSEVRACLFECQRTAHWTQPIAGTIVGTGEKFVLGESFPREDEAPYVTALVKRIRELVKARRLD